ncbi:murein L,D-transpeptidase catalytic domain family protein [Hymenobacter sp. BT186]|uniref:Murein L,D-transpeptidase catalytic domain family protein n=1 Tax=Hymenobacter telluris TaxID=2816474 RepID=A0A939J9M0_9BACT|nr:murein L,D-transpeptidase catalytic domain family protein [Hymenobacter telluris]MBO0357191.1 murein L,D-transpeptidase catalytic domain family protein [Hymenobacter telluris]MBW3373217.1 murein L,D-transpeptidase catalytic domain family protein [Hymenobacter norwichensis]
MTVLNCCLRTFLPAAWLLAGALTACQSTVGEPAAGPLAAATPSVALVAADSIKTASTLPDSLQLTPVLPLPNLPDSVRQAVRALQTKLGPEAADLRAAVLEQACVGYLTLRHAGRIQHGGVLAVADMDLPSSEKRLWVLDLEAGRVLHHSHVAHGRGSGHLRAHRFSNVMKSACTALGFYRTQDTYGGKHGLSRRLHGLDAGQNSNAESRYVVLHAADYVSASYVQQHGQAGYSRGCPALPPDQYKAIIKSLPEGSCLFLSGPGVESKWLNTEAAAQQLAARGWR